MSDVRDCDRSLAEDFSKQSLIQREGVAATADKL